MKERIKSFLGSDKIDTPEKWYQAVEEVLREADKFYDDNQLDDLTDIRLQNKVPDIADRLHRHVLFAPDGINQELRQQVYTVSKKHAQITLLFDMDELEGNMAENRQRDDQRANEILAEVLINEELQAPVQNALTILEGEDEV
jgi:hypothetical protein